ncbi:hypothetical protein YYG_03402 [Plasmodium vinckei petteri]|uniref:Uncharacterized protein n=1 Tax=Plasmodium vinckei petteri TaxID=138298 RepID=W7AHX8_PLAVN|nr:hypothetical protein YYG_03402 [Plasmodium vinckei petteri]CAD2111320.1 conserved Plasmodium protein, unknown function [Plasmodium vinckei petteri]
MSKVVKKTKKPNNVNNKKKKSIDTIIQKDENSLNYNPFTTKETIKPFDLDIEDEIIEKEEYKKDPFKELLKKRIKQMNAKANRIKENRDERETFEDEMEKSGRQWYKQNLVNDVPRKLTIM